MNNNQPEFFGIDMQAIINSHTAWPLNKQLATKLSVFPHFSIGEFFKSMSDEDVNFLSTAINETTMEDHAASEMFLMTMLLSLAEGLGLEDDNDLVRRYECFIVLVVCEAMARKGLAEIKHDNMSLGEDMKMADLVKATPTGMAVVAELLKRESQ
jgi:hypothetical protein